MDSSNNHSEQFDECMSFKIILSFSMAQEIQIFNKTTPYIVFAMIEGKIYKI